MNIAKIKVLILFLLSVGFYSSCRSGKNDPNDNYKVKKVKKVNILYISGGHNVFEGNKCLGKAGISTFISLQKSKKPDLIIVTGDNLSIRRFGKVKSPDLSKTELDRVEFETEIFSHMGKVLLSVGKSDTVFGDKWLNDLSKKYDIPIIGGNFESSLLRFGSINVNGVKIALLNFIEKGIGYNSLSVPKYYDLIRHDLNIYSPDLIIGTVSGSPDYIKRIANNKNSPSILFVSKPHGGWEYYEKIGATHIFQTAPRFEGGGYLQLTLVSNKPAFINQKSNKIKKTELIKLNSDIARLKNLLPTLEKGRKKNNLRRRIKILQNKIEKINKHEKKIQNKNINSFSNEFYSLLELKKDKNVEKLIRDLLGDMNSCD